MDLATAIVHRDAWRAANLALAQKQTYTISTPSGSRSLSYADLAEVHRQLIYWEGIVTRLLNGRGGGIRVRNVVLH